MKTTEIEIMLNSMDSFQATMGSSMDSLQATMATMERESAALHEEIAAWVARIDERMTWEDVVNEGTPQEDDDVCAGRRVDGAEDGSPAARAIKDVIFSPLTRSPVTFAGLLPAVGSPPMAEGLAGLVAAVALADDHETRFEVRSSGADDNFKRQESGQALAGTPPSGQRAETDVRRF